MTGIKLVRDLMTVGVPTCPLDTPIVEIAERLLNGEFEGVVVLDEEGHAAGVVSQRELVTAYAHDNCRSLTAQAIMDERVPQIPPDIPLTAAAQLMQDMGVRLVFMMHVADGIHYPAAMLSYRHLLRHLVAADDSDLHDLGIKATREAPLTAFIRRRDEARRRASAADQ